MADEYKDNGITFAPGNARFETGTRAGSTGFLINGVDLNTLYEDIANGFSAADAVTGFQSGGIDLGAIFAGVGTVISVLDGNDYATAAGTTFTSIGTTDTFPASPGPAYAGMEIQIDGDIIRLTAGDNQAVGTPTDIGDWITPKASANATDFEYRIGPVQVAGDTIPQISGSAIAPNAFGGAWSAWTNLNSDARWYLSVNGIDENSQFGLEIRHKTNTNIIGSCDIQLVAIGSIV